MSEMSDLSEMSGASESRRRRPLYDNIRIVKDLGGLQPLPGPGGGAAFSDERDRERNSEGEITRSVMTTLSSSKSIDWDR